MSFIFLFLLFLDRISFPLFLKCLLHYLSKLMYMGVYKYQCIELRSMDSNDYTDHSCGNNVRKCNVRIAPESQSVLNRSQEYLLSPISLHVAEKTLGVYSRSRVSLFVSRTIRIFLAWSLQAPCN